MQPRHLPLALLLGLALALPPAANAADNPFSKVQQSFGAGTNRVDLLADRAEYDWDSNWVDFYGNVQIQCNGNVLKGDHVRFNTKTQAAEAQGRVTLLGANGESWTGDSLAVDMKDPKSPKMRNVRGGNMTAYYDPYRLEAKSGGIRNGAYYADEVVFTTCTNAPGSRHYEFHARDVTIVPDDDLTAHGAVPYLFGVPFFYWPYFWKDLHNHYGFRFEPGYRSRWGLYLLTTYKTRLWRFDDENWGDSRTQFDMRSKRGFALGEQLNWYDTDVGDGWFSIYGLKDEYKEKKLLRDGITDTDRYRIRLNHDLVLTDADRILVQGLYVSDHRVMHDFFEDEYEEMPQPENYVNYTHTADAYNFGVEADFRLNEFYTQVERLPEVWFNVNQREVAESGFYYESENSADFLQKRYNEDAIPNAKDIEYDAGRFDTYHTLSYPLKVAGFLSVVPSASWRGTYYSKTKSAYVEDVARTVTATNELDVVYTYTETNSVTHIVEEGADFRNVVELGLELSFKSYGMWLAEDNTPWRHIIEPYAEYTYIPEPNVLPADLYQFDEIDEIDFTHTVRLGVRNRWQCKDPVAGPDGAIRRTKVREFAFVDAYADIRIEPEDDEDALAALHLDTTFRPTSWLRLKNELTYDPDASEISRDSALVQITHDRVRSSLEYVYRADASSLLMGEISWLATHKWQLALFGRYDFEASLAEKFGGYVQMNYDCISIRVMGSVYPGYTRTDGVEEEDDYRITFSIWEVRFPPNNVNKWHY